MEAVEIGAEATVDANERWQTTQSNLYAELGQQLKSQWTNGQKAPEKAVEAPVEGDTTETPERHEH